LDPRVVDGVLARIFWMIGFGATPDREEIARALG